MKYLAFIAIACLICMNIVPSYQSQTEYPEIINKLIGVVVLVKDDTKKNLVNWIQYHKSLGVDHIFVIDQNSTNPLINDILPFIQSSYVLTYDFFGENIVKRDMHWIYDYFIMNYQLNFHFFAFLYPNEYIFLKKNENLKDILHSYRSYGQLILASKDISHSQIKNQPKNCSVSREMRGIINTRHLDRDVNGIYHFTGSAYAVTSVGIPDNVTVDSSAKRTVKWNYVRATDPPKELFTNIFISRYEMPDEDAPITIHMDKEMRSKQYDCDV